MSDETATSTREDSGTEVPEHRAGRTAADLPEQQAPAEVASVEDVEEAMRDVVDPELGINVVDLGLVYDVRVEPDNTATIDMTLTSAACPLTDVIEDQTASVLVGGAGLVKDFRINWVWMPPWGPEKITEEGREQLRALGFTV
ncbi:Metal-sulfur cluster biosynthetic enzyme [Amycolatopsis arida]|uniref:Metal-sulfur cluster biosynthetic enzyme n=1 Tax=Amycolatopsis arida TaxID=587909 RepID=A0A1I5Z0H4_9PSEU|nr:metal-sulfur cluster assembly factor [Amycolatopsis arida]TDX90022.1 metal-sulfur cluster biosynthetic enzyme [Amycolatopsis arida]SFQ49952.1 Metal-sulfur cluster biosynthetic enzyme [Amycolatopsis arida]